MIKWLLILLAILPAPAFAQTLTVLTYSSFVGEYGPGQKLQAAFEKQCGCDLVFQSVEDGGAILTRLKIEGAASTADIVLGLDDNLMPEARRTGLFAESGTDVSGLSLPDPWTDKEFIPFDWGHFAFVYDADVLKKPPTSLKALVETVDGPKIILEDPRTSTPGLGFLVWMRRVYGDDAPAAWKQLSPRIVTVTRSWSEAYGLFLKGEADMVLSYVTSPAYHIGVEGKTNYKAAIFAEGHPLQVEVAAALKSSKNPDLSRRFLTFLLTDEAQSLLPETNWMFPARTPAAGLPASFKGLPMPAKTLAIEPDRIANERRAWIDEWLSALQK